MPYLDPENNISQKLPLQSITAQTASSWLTVFMPKVFTLFRPNSDTALLQFQCPHRSALKLNLTVLSAGFCNLM